jgi:hypothetical protein
VKKQYLAATQGEMFSDSPQPRQLGLLYLPASVLPAMHQL